MTQRTDYNLKEESAKLDGVSGFIVMYIEDYCTQVRFDRIFEATFNLYKMVERSFVLLAQHPRFPTRNLIEYYVNNELSKGWQELVVSILERRKRSHRAQKFLSLSQAEREIYSYKLRDKNLSKKISRFYKSRYYDFLGSYFGRKVTNYFYKKCSTCYEKLWFDIKWGTQYYSDEKLGNHEINEMLDYGIGVVEEMSKTFSPSIISEADYSGKTILETLDSLYEFRYNLTWIFNRLIYLRPNVKPEHVKLLYNTFSPNSYDIEYAVQGLAYFGQTDMECRRLAYEGLEKFISTDLRQCTIENMKFWYGDFPRDLYEKYTTEYNEQTGENLTY